MTTETVDGWRPFLERWSGEWADAQAPDAGSGDKEAVRARWLGFAPASEERIRALEERIGHRLPPSYRTFLAVTDGWRHAGAFVRLLAGTERARPHEDASGLSEYFPGELDDDSTPEDELLAGMWHRALELQVESDAVYVLLDPGDTDDAGEWALYTWAPWHAAPPERYASFRAFMEAMYREFHRLQGDRSLREGREFVNATTRAVDASVETARLDALSGRHEEAAAVLADAAEYGRPRAKGLHDQLRRLLGETSLVSFDGLASDPLYAPEFLPVLLAERVRTQRSDSALVGIPVATRTARESAQDLLRQLSEGTFRYVADGPFGEAVERAREQARWGDTDAAWHTLRTALPEWRPLGPDHLAPVGLCADPLLGFLITRERGRELLAIPRAARAGQAGQQGEPPAPTADLDPPGLAWLADQGPGRFLSSYRFVLVEGVEPDELPGLIGAEGVTGLSDPATPWEARLRSRGVRPDTPWADEAATVVGRAGPGWSFALEPGPGAHLDERRLVPPGIVASRGRRAVTVWSAAGGGGLSSGVFHLSVAEDGEERYAFTVRGATRTKRGTVPYELDPDRLFADGESPEGRPGERRTLEVLGDRLGVRLPRFALEHGRLHSFRTRPWNRAPGPGEVYLTVRMTPLRP
ncbi:SMI1/KNR4 family protein [Streptomyces sp. NPDC003688]